MSRVLVDTSVLLDVLTEDTDRRHRLVRLVLAAARQLCEAWRVVHQRDRLCRGLDRLRAHRASGRGATTRRAFSRLELPWEAAFLAGKAFLRYRQARDTRRSPLADFFIGAHAAIAGMQLLTRDARRYRTYYPKIELICP